MTRKEIEKLEREIKTWDNTEEKVQVRKEISCREMINCILIYDGICALIRNGKLNEYLRKYVDQSQSFFFIGLERVLKLIDEQVEDFKKAFVTTNVYTDGEGCTYNSCTWADD